MGQQTVRIAIIACDVLRDEIGHFAKEHNHIAHIEILQQGLHNEPPVLRGKLQEAIDKIESLAVAQAIVLGYGLCSRGIEGVCTRQCKLVVPRAHDCITLLLGDKQRYAQYVKEYPGTYWYSPGWNRCAMPPGPQRHQKLLKQYEEKYGKEDAQFLMETEQNWFKSYQRATYVDLGVAVTPPDLQFTRDCAKWLGWQYDHQHGDPKLLQDLLGGNWDEQRFLVLEPGQTARMTADHQIIALQVSSKEGTGGP
jgi:hypothetical protein